MDRVRDDAEKEVEAPIPSSPPRQIRPRRGGGAAARDGRGGGRTGEGGCRGCELGGYGGASSAVTQAEVAQAASAAHLAAGRARLPYRLGCRLKAQRRGTARLSFRELLIDAISTQIVIGGVQCSEIGTAVPYALVVGLDLVKARFGWGSSGGRRKRERSKNPRNSTFEG
ncbi:hypothetical protein ACP70R_015809 [Stipagrostis hirtigluma subsp. patula]